MAQEFLGSSGSRSSNDSAAIVGKFRTGEGRPVVALDIDGTLGDYHGHFLWFAEKWLGSEMPHASEVNPGMRLSEFMGVPHHVYQSCKLAYRQGGLKRFMPAYPFASELTKNIRSSGAEVWLCTTRPYLRLDNIDPDTREWLHRNDIHYDAVIFESKSCVEDYPVLDKYRELVRQVGIERIIAAVDDLPDQISSALACGILKVYLRDQPYNRGLKWADVTRIHSLESLSVHISNDIHNWNKNNG